MKKYLSIISLFLLIGAILSSCTIRSHDFTLLSTKNIDFNKNYSITKKSAEGEAVVSIIIVIPTGNILDASTFKEAVDNAIESVPGAIGLTNVVISHYSWYIPFIYGQQKVIVTGDPIVSVTAKVSDNLFFKGEYNKDNELVEFKAINEIEFNLINN